MHRYELRVIIQHGVMYAGISFKPKYFKRYIYFSFERDGGFSQILLYLNYASRIQLNKCIIHHYRRVAYLKRLSHDYLLERTLMCFLLYI